MKTGSESIEVIMGGRWILSVAFLARLEDKRLSKKCGMSGELVGGAGFVGSAGKRLDGVSPGRP